MIWMTIGQTTMNHEKLAALFPKSNELQGAVCEYLICVVQLCQTIAEFMAKSPLSQLVSPIISSRSFDKDVGDLKSQLDIWSACINRAVTTLAVDTTLTTARDVGWMRQVFDSKSKADRLALYEDKRNKLMRRLSPRHRELQSIWRRERRKGSVEWLFKNQVYRAWRVDDGPQALLIHGSLGSGKTVLMANIVGDLHMLASEEASNSIFGRPMVASFFCQRDTATRFDQNVVLGSILQQFIDQMEPTQARKCLDDITNLDADIGELLKIITYHISPTASNYVVLDGLDIPSVDHEAEVKLLLQTLGGLSRRLNLSLCISLRRTTGIREDLMLSFSCRSISMAQAAKNDEMAAYIIAEVDQRAQNSSLSPQLLEIIKQTLIVGANGMYLWAALLIETIFPLYRQKVLSPRDIERLLDQLPPTLEGVYNSLLAQIDDNRYESLIFRLVATAVRPLTATELVVALNVTPDNTTWDPLSLPSNPSTAVVSCSGGVLEVDEEDGAVYFIHHSAILHLMDDEEAVSDQSIRARFSFSMRQGQEYMGGVCITYLNLNIHDRRLVKKQKEMNAMGIIDVVRTTASSGSNKNLAWALSKFKQQPGSTTPQLDLARILRDLQRLPIAESSEKDVAFLEYASEHWHEHIAYETSRTSDASLLRKITNGQLQHVKLPWTSAKKSLVEWCIVTDQEALLAWVVKQDTIFDQGNNHLDEIADVVSDLRNGAKTLPGTEIMKNSRSVLTQSLHRVIWARGHDTNAASGLFWMGASATDEVVAPERAWSQWNSLDLLMHRLHERRRAKNTWEGTGKPFPISRVSLSSTDGPRSLHVSWKKLLTPRDSSTRPSWICSSIGKRRPTACETQAISVYQSTTTGLILRFRC